jgi:osmotically-inducible protein OsmY
MNHLKKFFPIAATCLFLLTPALPQAPDNTAQNKKDPGATAQDQGTTPADIELARKIRSSVTDDKGLSTYAHNVKIIVNNGAVTLRGPVRSSTERVAIESKAAAIAGAAKITNELTVTPDK